MDASKPEPAAGTSDLALEEIVRRHQRFGWWALFVFASLGMGLEAMHAFKVDWYMRVSHETRRLMFTLAHSHGTLLALLNIAFALSLPRLAAGGWRRVASGALLGASVLLPLGFLLGGLVVYAGDPGAGILLVPVGGLLLVVALLATALRNGRSA